jgi:peroxiredoxin
MEKRFETLRPGAEMPAFELMGTDGQLHRSKDFDDQVLVVFFTCNHCPYVLGSDEHTRKLAEEYGPQGVRFIGINSNSSALYEIDSFEHMVMRMEQEQFPWLYLHDVDQTVAYDFGGLKTPHFFVFDEDRILRYTGRSIDNPRDWTQSNSCELKDALDDVLAAKEVQVPVTNPIGCTIKWEGKESGWMPEGACDLV